MMFLSGLDSSFWGGYLGDAWTSCLPSTRGPRGRLLGKFIRSGRMETATCDLTHIRPKAGMAQLIRLGWSRTGAPKSLLPVRGETTYMKLARGYFWDPSLRYLREVGCSF